MALTTTIDLSVVTALTGALDLSTPTDTLNYPVRVALSSGTGVGAADMVWHDQRTIAASGTDDLDLAGALTGPLGTTLTFARIKGLLVRAAAGNTNNVNVTRPATNGVPLFLAASDGLSLKPGGLFLWVAPDATGIAVTASTGDLITMGNSGSGTPVTYDVVIIGASA